MEDSIVNTVRMGNYIRVALSQVKEDKIMHFVDMQKKFGIQECKNSFASAENFRLSENRFIHCSIASNNSIAS
jgi:hypothetical protein